MQCCRLYLNDEVLFNGEEAHVIMMHDEKRSPTEERDDCEADLDLNDDPDVKYDIVDSQGTIHSVSRRELRHKNDVIISGVIHNSTLM